MMPPSYCPMCQTTLIFLNKNRAVCENCISLNNMSHCHYQFSNFATYQIERAFIELNNNIFNIVNFYFTGYSNKSKIRQLKGIPNEWDVITEIEDITPINENSIKRILSLKAFI